MRTGSFSIFPFIIAALTLVVAVLAWIRPDPFSSPGKNQPAMYELRVSVVTPSGRLIRDAEVFTSAGNEPHRLPNGGLEIQIPLSKVPRNGQVELIAEHPDWASTSQSVILKEDKNPTVRITLTSIQPSLQKISGVVLTTGNRKVPGAHVRAIGATEIVTTDEAGQFSLEVLSTAKQKIHLIAEHSDLGTTSSPCFLEDNCYVWFEGN